MAANQLASCKRAGYQAIVGGTNSVTLAAAAAAVAFIRHQNVLLQPYTPCLHAMMLRTFHEGGNVVVGSSESLK